MVMATLIQNQVREINETALESITTMLQKQSVKDAELKDKLKASQEEVKQLQQQIKHMQANEGTGQM